MQLARPLQRKGVRGIYTLSLDRFQLVSTRYTRGGSHVVSSTCFHGNGSYVPAQRNNSTAFSLSLSLDRLRPASLDRFQPVPTGYTRGGCHVASPMRFHGYDYYVRAQKAGRSAPDEVTLIYRESKSGQKFCTHKSPGNKTMSSGDKQCQRYRCKRPPAQRKSKGKKNSQKPHK